ncbi:conserved oligomeric Golgi complex subunit 6 [Arctopsyche grandis]|uniref:conserved oligomeric Golgi complex subunit 6 n=1 Tax=Arctopsyche grandis TaxID=121162 RepID=UPI00406D7684
MSGTVGLAGVAGAVAASGEVRESGQRLCAAAAAMWERSRATKAATTHLLQRTDELRRARLTLQKRGRIAAAMGRHFQVTAAECAALHGLAKDSPLTADFFAAIERVERLHEECKSLVHCGFETAALDVMEKISLHREAAVERLFRWTQKACRHFDTLTHTHTHTHTHLDSLVPRALEKLQSRPVLFKYVVDEYCAARKSDLVRAFINALTEGGAGKPIEHNAHDPERYTSDILSWVRQILPLEKENLAALFKRCDQIDSAEEIRTTLADITEGLCHPLKVRIELILTSDKNPVLLCAIVNLLRFYGRILNDELRGGLLFVTLDELRIQGENVFLAAVEIKVKADLGRGVKAPPSNLSPSPIVSDLLSFLREIFAATPISDQRERADLLKAVSFVIDPLLRAVNETACHLSSSDMAVYLLNCIYQIQCTISLCQFVNDYGERLQAQSDAQMDTLTSEQASSLVANLNLGPIYTILQGQEKGPLSAIPGMESSALRSFMNKFDSFIAMPDVFLLPQITLLVSSANKISIRKRSFEVILAIYKNLHSSIHNPNNKYENPNTIVRRTPEEVSELLAL